MKCPECKKRGLKSKLNVGPTYGTCMAHTEYYDEDGKYHMHDPNKYTKSFYCSNDHRGYTETKNKCRSCEYGGDFRYYLDGEEKPDTEIPSAD